MSATQASNVWAILLVLHDGDELDGEVLEVGGGGPPSKTGLSDAEWLSRHLDDCANDDAWLRDVFGDGPDIPDGKYLLTGVLSGEQQNTIDSSDYDEWFDVESIVFYGQMAEG